jgi:predicted O-methyltransferase YrrM
MAEQLWQAVDEFLEGELLASDPVLEQVLADAAAAGLPSIQVSALQGQFLNILAASIGARLILEIGTLGGYSSIWLARALPKDGRLISLELNPEHAKVAQLNLDKAGLGDAAEIRLGAALDTLPRLANEFPHGFDFIFIDADKANLPAYYEWSLKLARPGALVVTDNVVRKGRIVEAENPDNRVQGARRFIQAAGQQSKHPTTIIQTVGAKGYDGLAITRIEDKGERYS